jgi:hypothetical protein
MKLLGLRHDVVKKEEIVYLLFYDIDTPRDDIISVVDNVMKAYAISYFLIKTKNGYHVIGLTPLSALKWARAFTDLQLLFNSYYGGIIIRLSRKPQEVQELLAYNFDYGEVIPNLYNLYAPRFNMEKRHWVKELAKYLLVFEKYRTDKE